MKLKKTKESDSGLNTEFVNTESGRHITLDHAIEQIDKGNPGYKNYITVDKSNGTTYIRSKPDGRTSNNIE